MSLPSGIVCRRNHVSEIVYDFHFAETLLLSTDRPGYFIFFIHLRDCAEQRERWG